MEEKILAAAEKLFVQNGYPLTSTTQIAKEAGCNQALVHYYFRTKERLFQVVLGGKIKRVFKEFISLEQGQGTEGKTFEEKLTRLIEVHYDAVRENENMVLFLMNGLTRNEQMFHSLLSEVGEVPFEPLHLFRQELEAEIKAGRIRPITLAQLFLNVASLNVFLFAVKPVVNRLWNYTPQEMEAFLDERKKEVVKTIIGGLRP